MKKQVIVITLNNKVLKVCELKTMNLAEIKELKEQALENEFDLIKSFAHLQEKVESLEHEVAILKGEE